MSDKVVIKTVPELKTRTERLHRFESAREVEDSLQALSAREPALVALVASSVMARSESREAVRMVRGLVGSSIEGSEGPEGIRSTTITSSFGCARNAIAHSTSAES